MKFASKRLLQTFLALSLLSLFADIIYEGARSIGGAYLNLLAAPAIAAGILGFGELLSYLMTCGVPGISLEKLREAEKLAIEYITCLLYTSDAADE